MSNIIDSSKRKTSNIQSNGKSHLDEIIPQSIQQQLLSNWNTPLTPTFLALILATVRLTSMFIIRLLHDVTSAEEFLLKKSNQNFLLFTCNTSLKYISCFFRLVKKVSNVFRIHFSKIMECFFVSGILFSFSSTRTRKKYKAQTQTQEKLQG